MGHRWFGTTRRLALGIALAAGLGAGDASAQGRPEGAGGTRPRGGALRTPEQRAELERRFEERLSAVVQRELRTTPEQTQRLGIVARRFERERRPLFQREMLLRRELRQQLGTTTPDEARVDGAVRELLHLQRRRIDLTEEEQRALAAFLTPVQRARYLALQENLRQRVEHRGREGRVRAGGRGARPPARRR